MAQSYIPRPDAERFAWMRNFADHIVADASRYFISPDDAAAIDSAVVAFADAYRLALDPATATRPARIAKDQARKAVEDLCRSFASPIKTNRAILDADKSSIGVRPLNTNRTRIHCPQTQPSLEIVNAKSVRHILRYHNPGHDGSAKPFGAIGVQLFLQVDDGPGLRGDPAKATYVGTFTRNPITVEFSRDDDHKKATYWARWVSRRGEVGPWSVPVCMSIAA